MMEDPHTIGAAWLFLVSRNLERVADLATNIGEDVVSWSRAARSSTMPKIAARRENARHGRFGDGLSRRLAAIDVGSNTIPPPQCGLRSVRRSHHHRRSRGSPRLGAGLGTTGGQRRGHRTGAPEPDWCHQLCAGSRAIAAVATAAVREAANGAEFVSAPVAKAFLSG
jgi:hypothetical protein